MGGRRAEDVVFEDADIVSVFLKCAHANANCTTCIPWNIWPTRTWFSRGRVPEQSLDSTLTKRPASLMAVMPRICSCHSGNRLDVFIELPEMSLLLSSLLPPTPYSPPLIPTFTHDARDDPHDEQDKNHRKTPGATRCLSLPKLTDPGTALLHQVYRRGLVSL